MNDFYIGITINDKKILTANVYGRIFCIDPNNNYSTDFTEVAKANNIKEAKKSLIHYLKNNDFGKLSMSHIINTISIKLITNNDIRLN